MGGNSLDMTAASNVLENRCKNGLPRLNCVEELGHMDSIPLLILRGGVAQNIPLAATTSLSTIYNEPYSHPTQASLLCKAAAESGCSHLLVAAGLEGEDCLKVAALAPLEVVLGSTSGNETHLFNGVHWYNSDHKSIGFAPNGNVTLGNADTACRDDPLRLSWHLDIKALIGGWRAGELCDLDKREDWRKYIWGISL